MCSKLFKLFACLTILTSCNAYSNGFTLKVYSDNQYILKQSSHIGNDVIIDMQGGNELLLVGEYNVTCKGDNYIVPLVKGDIDNAESNAEYYEYVVFSSIGGKFTPLKTISSFNVISRDSGELVESHVLNPKAADFLDTLCTYIVNKTNYEYPVQVIGKTETN
ncbi:hypothetical protein [Photobacterium kagoshimensis]|uniref:hypothetical protein n=1 Tax=Photobacterium kagoshimensis TaxID=2910242 RepID=UPI003D0B1CE9